MAEQQKQLRPFRNMTRQRRQLNSDDNLKTLTVGGSPINFQIDRVGFLSGIIMKVYGTVTLSSAGALAGLGAANLIRNVQVKLLNGNITLADYSGYHLGLINNMLAYGFGVNAQAAYTPSTAIQSTPVASGANTWVQHFFIPISLNPGSQFDTGIINCQSSQNVVNVQITPAAQGSDFVTNYSSASLTVQLENLYYDVPPPSMARWPVNQIVRRIQNTTNITATGETRYEIERQGILLQAIGVVQANGARTNSLNDITLRTNSSSYIYVDDPTSLQFLYEMNYGKACPTGVYVLDLFHAGEDPTSYDFRDALNLELYTKTEYIADVTAGTTLGSGNNFLDVTEVRLVNLAR